MTAAEFSLPEEQYKEFTEAFHAVDKNNSGLLSPFELGILMRSLGHNPTEAELNQIIQDYDAYAKGGINVHDFLTVMSKREQDTALQDKLLNAFRVFDRDGNGFVSYDELRSQMMTIGNNPYTEKEFEEFMSEYQPEPDGQIDYNAFAQLMLKKG